jgi:ribosome-binding factor A
MANPRTIARLEARILERAAHALEHEISDPRTGFVTLTRCKLAKDLSSARIYYSVLGDDAERANTARMLESAAGYLQRLIGRTLDLRRVPHILWTFDESIAEMVRMDDAIARALERDRRIATEGSDPLPDQDDVLPLPADEADEPESPS